MDMFKVEIETDNEAFDVHYDNQELIRILKEICKDLEEGEMDRVIRDVNGNGVGRWVYRI